MAGQTDIRYFDRLKTSETIVSCFFAALTSPLKMFRHLPAPQGYKNSLILMAWFMVIPSIMLSIITGIITAIVIIPVSLFFGLGTTWLWSVYLAWASRHFTGSKLSTEEIFQICAYSAAPLAVAWGEYMATAVSLWNLILVWLGLVYYGKIGMGKAAFIMLAGIAALALMIAIAVTVTYLWIPENVEMLLETVETLHRVMTGTR